MYTLSYPNYEVENFAGIPYDIQLKREQYYQTIFYMIFRLLGLQVAAEVRTSRGRIDAVVELERDVFLFEFKLDGSAQEALAQIKEREYFVRSRGRGKTLHLIGVQFEMGERGIVDWQVADLPAG